MFQLSPVEASPPEAGPEQQPAVDPPHETPPTPQARPQAQERVWDAILVDLGVMGATVFNPWAWWS